MTQTELNRRLNEALEVFLTVLRSCWQPMRVLAERMSGRDANEVLADWAQSNWEMIVEAAVSTARLVFIEPYGEGADCNGQSSRVWRPEATVTHVIHCVPVQGTEVTDVLTGQRIHLPDVGLPLDRFGTCTENGWYSESPPFDHVLVFTGGRETLISLHEVRFILRDIE